MRFLGSLGDAALGAHLAASDGLLLTRRPARAEELAFPTRLVEYLRHGRPVFVSDVGDVARYLVSGRDAVLLDAHDAERAAASVAAVAERPDRGASIGLAGRAAGARAFDRRRPRRAAPRVRGPPAGAEGGVSALRVDFLFAARGIGGAERSMIRLMREAHPLRLDCRVIVPAAENADLRAAVEGAGVPYHGLAAWDMGALSRLVGARRPDVVYVFGRFRTIPWALVARRAGARCVVAAERSAANRRSDRWARRLDRRVVDAYVANSEAGAERVRAAVGADGPPVFVVRNGVARPEGPERIAPTADPPVLLCVGNISENKGQDLLLEAVRRLQARWPGLRATLVGRDHTGGRFFRDVDARGLADTYTAVGFAADVRPHLARATLVALPTRHREGTPTAVLEAMRAGVPVVASAVGGVAEIVEDGRTGVLVPPGDAAALAGAIERLLDDEPLRRRLASAARRHVARHHGVEAMLEGHLSAFRERPRARGARARPGRPRDHGGHVAALPAARTDGGDQGARGTRSPASRPRARTPRCWRAVASRTRRCR